MTYSPSPIALQEPFIICSHSRWGACHANLFPAGANWPTANLALFLPFVIHHQRTYRSCVWANGTVTGGQANIDIGIYDYSGTRLGSLGSTAQGATGTTNVAAFGTPITIDAGRYLMAMACDGNADGFQRTNTNSRQLGMLMATTSFVLPSSVTLATATTNYQPVFGICELSTL